MEEEVEDEISEEELGDDGEAVGENDRARERRRRCGMGIACRFAVNSIRRVLRWAIAIAQDLE